MRGHGNDRPTSIHDTQQQAMDLVRDIAANWQGGMVIQGRDGKIVSAIARVPIHSRSKGDLEAVLAGFPFYFARANPRANHFRRRAHKWLANNAVYVRHGEEVDADFERHPQ